MIPAEWQALLQLLPGYDPCATAGDAWFEPAAAQRAIDFFPECLTHVEGDCAGKPFVLEPWEKAIIGNLWGWKRKDAQGRTVRRYREALIYLPRKSGKTPLVAGLAILCYFTDGEPGAQCYIAAESREQAGKLFRHLKGMVLAEPELSNRCRAYGGTAQAGQSKSIVKHDDPTSFIQVISADADTQHGGNTHLAVIDELHTQPNRDLVDVLTTSMASQGRKQPLLICVTTADYMRESICNEKYLYACNVRDRVIENPRFLPVIYEAKQEEDWTSEEVWRKANPNLGVSVSLEYLQGECERAKATPAYENTFRRLHLNQRTETDVRWLPMEVWDRGGAPFNPADLKGKPCFAGVDFGWRDDYAALVLVFPPEEEAGIWYVLPWFWLAENGARNKREEPTRTFLAEKLVTVTPGNATDMEAIYKQLDRCRQEYDLREVALDPANARKQGQDLMNAGYEVFEFVQSKRNYNEPCQLLFALLKDGRLRHGGHKVLRWMAANTQVEMNGLGEIMPKKKRSPEKIDGICGLAMGTARAMLREVVGVPSVILL